MVVYLRTATRFFDFGWILATGGAGKLCVRTKRLGGAGVTPLTAAVAGLGGTVAGGGGGGGLGRIRINTADRTYTKANTTSEFGSLSAGVISTR